MKRLMHWMHQYVVDRNVFRDCLKLFPQITGSRKLSSREFQTDGPATQKARRSWKLSRWRSTTSCCRAADRRWCRDWLAQFHDTWYAWAVNISRQWTMSPVIMFLSVLAGLETSSAVIKLLHDILPRIRFTDGWRSRVSSCQFQLTIKFWIF